MSIVIPDGARPTLPTRSSKIATATWPVGEVSQGDRRLFSGSAANLQVRDSLDLFTGALHQDDLGRGIIPKVLAHLAQSNVALQYVACRQVYDPAPIALHRRWRGRLTEPRA